MTDNRRPCVEEAMSDVRTVGLCRRKTTRDAPLLVPKEKNTAHEEKPPKPPRYDT